MHPGSREMVSKWDTVVPVQRHGGDRRPSHAARLVLAFVVVVGLVTAREAACAAEGRSTDAGLLPLVLAALLAAAGVFVAGKLAHAAVSGGIVGGVVGLVLGFVAMYQKYSNL